MTDEADAIVVGSGINGLVSAAELVRAGWSVILEGNAEIGGFIATEERTLPGYLHDTFSSWHPMFVSSPAYAALGELLHRHGLEYRNTDGWVTASVADDGRATLAHRDPERTAAEFTHAEDRCAYLAMLQRWARTWRRSAACWAARCASSRWCGTRSVWSAAAGCAAPNGGCARRSPAAGLPAPGLPRARGRPPVLRRGCCMPGSPRTTPAAGS